MGPVSKGDSGDVTLPLPPLSSADGDSIKVFVRVRPPSDGTTLLEDGKTGLCLSVLSSNTLRIHSKPEPKLFTFDCVADVDTNQEDVFSAVAKNIIESCVNGYNGTIFAYGQTGSGKTFTMLGPSESDNFSHNLRGIIPRSFEYLFFLINREKEKGGQEKNFLCKCSFIEIYNEQIFDLLDSASPGLLLREKLTKGVFVVGANEPVINSAAEAYQVLSVGWRNRRVASTSMNRESSRSHAVFTVTIESVDSNGGIVNHRSSQLNLVDLAGSERQKDTHTEGVRLKEASSINRSLSCLGQVIMALVDVAHGKQRHICYRDSKLTFLLRDSLGGNAKTYIIANVHPGSKCFGETLSTLQFAQRAKLIKNKRTLRMLAGDSLSYDLIEALKALNESTGIQYVHLLIEENKWTLSLPEDFTYKLLDASLDRDAVWSNICKDFSKTYRRGKVGESRNDSCNAFRHGRDSSSSHLIHTANAVQETVDEVEYRSHFLEAMQFLERTESEKKNLLEKVAKLEELSTKKEMFIQSSKMIVKFRDDHIARLEKTLRENACTLPAEDKDAQISELIREIKALKEQFGQLWETCVTACSSPNGQLPPKKAFGKYNVLQSFKSLYSLPKPLPVALALVNSAAAAKHLVNSNPTLSDKAGKVIGMPVHSTPINNESISSASVERMKARLLQAQTELTTLKQEFEEYKEITRKTSREHESELGSCQKMIKQLESILEATKAVKRHEVSKLNKMHAEVLKNITTPTKGYDLRSRLIPRLSPEGECNGYLHIESPESPEVPVDIINEPMPPEMSEQAYEAIAEELKMVQEQVIALQTKLDEEESKSMKLQQQTEKLECHSKDMEELFSSEKANWMKEQEELHTQIKSFENQLQDFEKRNEGKLLGALDVFNTDTLYYSAGERIQFGHPFGQKRNILKGQIIRTSRMTSEDVDFYKDSEYVKNMFKERGYPAYLIEEVYKVVLEGRKGRFAPILGQGDSSNLVNYSDPKLFSSEKANWMKEQEELHTQIKSFENQLQDFEKRNEELKSEVFDLRVVLQSADKELLSVKNEYSSYKRTHEAELSQLSSKLIDVELQLDNVRLDHEQVLDEKRSLQDAHDNLQEVMQYEVNQLKEQLKDTQQENYDLKCQVGNLQELLETERECNTKMSCQLEEHKESNSKELLKAIDECVQLKKQSCELTARCEQQATMIQKLEQNLSSSKDTIAVLEKAQVADKEALTDLMNQIQKLKAFISHQTESLTLLTREKEDISSKYNSEIVAKEEYREVIEKQEKQIEELKEKMERIIASGKIERELLSEELAYGSEQLEKLLHDFNKQAEMLQACQTDVQCKENIIQDLQQQLTRKKEDLEKIKNELEQHLTTESAAQITPTTPRTPRTPSNLGADLVKILESNEKELRERRETMAALELLVTELHTERMEKNEEILRLKGQLCEMENMRIEMQTWISQCHDLQSKLEECGQRKAVNSDDKASVKPQQKPETEKELEEKEKMAKEIEVLRKQVENLAEENGKLVGHQNLNQKIQYLVKLKKENARLIEEAEVLRRENKNLKENSKKPELML
ncbi:kinesin-like protein KIF15 [Protopterus annectens]|uniref:kinesin-like protein KIF15 n=1 Tax=Protopterus annectens TaxID=7888 RepID=UPI001CFB81E6|nr:kinesin-like protein KIF15 [Protopterus annectens]